MKIRSASSGEKVKGNIRKLVLETVSEYIQNNSVDGRYIIFNEDNNLSKKLYLRQLHKTVYRHNGMFMATADFVDGVDSRYTIDFMVAERDHTMYVMNATLFFFNRKDTEHFGRGMTMLKVA